MEIAGESPSILSTSGLSITPKNCRAYDERDSTYRRWPSAYRVSNANEDFPDPESPVMTTRRLRGNSTRTFFRLCARAPSIMILPSLKTSDFFIARYYTPIVKKMEEVMRSPVLTLFYTQRGTLS